MLQFLIGGGGILCFIYTIWYVWKTEVERKRHNYVPGPYKLPIIGSTLQLAFAAGLNGSHYQRLQRMCKKYGKTVFAGTCVHKLMVTEDPTLIKEVIDSPDWSNRYPDHPQFKEYSLSKNLGLVWSSGESHRQMRKFVAQGLAGLGYGQLRTSEALIENELTELFKSLDAERLASAYPNQVFMQHRFKVSTFNVLWQIVAGSRFEQYDPKIEQLIHAVEDITRINVGVDPEYAFPILRYIPGCSPLKAKRPSLRICYDYLNAIVAQRKKGEAYKHVQNDFIDVFLKKIDEEKPNPHTLFTDEQLQVTCIDLLFGGLDTTSNSLEFAILYITKFPHVQEKVQQEIDAVLGAERTPSIRDRTKLRYTEAVMLEVLRIACIVPVNGRTASRDTKIGNYNVKQGTLCGLNFTVVQMSEEIWGDPKVFRPERFLNENNEIVNAEKIFPFGGGKRHCPGYPMAKVIFFTFICALLQRYTFSRSPVNPLLSIVPDPGITNTAKPFYCIVTPRNITN